MPIYEYRCEKCSEEFEQLIRSDSDTVACPKCGAAEVERLLSTFSARVAFKMPACEGATPACSQSRCRGGGCGLANQ